MRRCVNCTCVYTPLCLHRCRARVTPCTVTLWFKGALERYTGCENSHISHSLCRISTLGLITLAPLSWSHPRQRSPPMATQALVLCWGPRGQDIAQQTKGGSPHNDGNSHDNEDWHFVAVGRYEPPRGQGERGQNTKTSRALLPQRPMDSRTTRWEAPRSRAMRRLPQLTESWRSRKLSKLHGLKSSRSPRWSTTAKDGVLGHAQVLTRHDSDGTGREGTKAFHLKGLCSVGRETRAGSRLRQIPTHWM